MLTSALLLAGATSIAFAQDIVVSPDITITLNDGTVVHDESVVELTTGLPNVVDVGPLPAGVSVESYHSEGGSTFFTLDTVTSLPDGGSGLIVEPRDIVKLTSGDYDISFSGADAGIPRGVAIDAVTLLDSRFVMSFDTTVLIGGSVIQDEDLAIDLSGSLVPLFDASATGVSPSLDLDAVHVLDNGARIVASFDGHGEVDGILFADEDTLVFEAGAWQPFVTGLSLDDEFGASDLNALMVLPPTPEPGALFMDGFESGDTSLWSSTTP